MWQGLVIVTELKRAPHLGCMIPSVQGLREKRTEEGTPYVVGVHVVVEGRREKRLQRASGSKVELLD